jgi:hypothetical protein
MINPLAITFGALLYPGLLTALLAGAVFGGLVGVGGRPVAGGLRSREGLAAVASVLFAAVGLAALPWPLHAAPPGTAWLWAWAGFELAFLLPLVPPLAAGAPAVARAAIREAQLGVLARAVLWAALAAALALHADWRPATLPAHLLALAAAVLILPAAIGWGPFDAEVSVTPEGTQHGLPDATRSLDSWGRAVRSGSLIVAACVVLLPTASGPPWLGLAMAGAGLLSACLALRQLRGRLPRLTLPAALRVCTLWALPVAVLASVALVVALP